MPRKDPAAYYRSEKYKDYHREKRMRAAGLNFTNADFEAMLLSQGGVCAICGGENPNGNRLSVDHDHLTNEVRGLLCHNCNLALGHLKDDPDRALAAAEYLVRSVRES